MIKSMSESMAEGFRIERISIEGFKGFTRAQEVDLKNRPRILARPEWEGQVKHH